MAKKSKGSSNYVRTGSVFSSFWTWRVSRRWRLPIAYFLTIQQVAIPLVAGVAQSIRTDGRTQTTVTTQGKVTDITTKTIRNTNAFNSFSTFDVAQDNTVNL